MTTVRVAPLLCKPLVAINRVGVMLEGICLPHTAVKDPVDISQQGITHARLYAFAAQANISA